MLEDPERRGGEPDDAEAKKKKKSALLRGDRRYRNRFLIGEECYGCMVVQVIYSTRQLTHDSSFHLVVKIKQVA